MTDAIVRTIYRKLDFAQEIARVGHGGGRRESCARRSAASFFRFMLPAELLALVAVVLTLIVRPTALA